MRTWLLVIALVETTVLAVDVTGSLAQGLPLISTAQMWGSEYVEGKVEATVGIAGECRQRARTLTCQFVRIGMSPDGECIISTLVGPSATRP